MTEPNYSVGFTALTLGTSGSIAVGDALVFNATTGYWLTATSANRTAADSRAQAIALTAYGGSAVSTVSYQAAGILATSISGLAATTPGLYQLVRVSTTGRLERVASYTDGDDIVGYAYPDGRVALHIGIPWALIAGTFAGASLPDYSVQYRKTDGTLGGAAHASIDGDGYLVADGVKISGTPTTGQILRASSGTVATWDDETAPEAVVLAGDVTGDSDANSVVKIRNVAVAATSPNAGQSHVYDSVGATFSPAHAFRSVANADATTTTLSTTESATGRPYTSVRFTHATPELLSVAAGYNGQQLLISTTTGPMTVRHDSGSAVQGADKILCPGDADVTLEKGAGALLVWSTGANRWYLAIAHGGAASAGTARTTASTTQGVLTVTGNDSYTYTGSGAATCTGFTAPAAGVARTIDYANDTEHDVSFLMTDATADGLDCDGSEITLPAKSAVAWTYSHTLGKWLPHVGAVLVGA